MTFVDAEVTWLEAANRCVEYNGRLAVTFDLIGGSSPAIRAHHIPSSCVWVGATKDYLRWTIPSGKRTRVGHGLDQYMDAIALGAMTVTPL